MPSAASARYVGVAKPATWLPLAVLPIVAVWCGSQAPAWVAMWMLALAIYAGLKWFSFAHVAEPGAAPFRRAIGYLLLWPGMDPRPFLTSAHHAASPQPLEWTTAFAKTVLGISLIAAAVALAGRDPFVAGWIGMVGIVLTLHFGLFHLLSVAWRQGGVDARRLMNAPLLATSLNDFWSKRWNLAFRDLAHAYVFRPSVGKLGVAGATMAVFVVSGLIHDAVISLPACGGYGLPTLYFVIQGAGVLFERSRLGKRWGTRRGVFGRAFCAAITLGPIGLLFHRPFVERVVMPMLLAMR